QVGSSLAPIGGGGGCSAAPTAPSGIAATANSSTQVTVTWTDNSSGTNTAEGLSVGRATGACTSWAQGGSTQPANTTSFVDTTVSGSTSYKYRVKATNSCGDSAYSTLASPVTTPAGGCTAAPTAPSGIAATANSSTQVTVTWTDNSSGTN